VENRCLGSLRPRLSCHGRLCKLVVLLGVGVLLVGCATTHALGRIDDDGVRTQVDAIAANAMRSYACAPRPEPAPCHSANESQASCHQGSSSNRRVGSPVRRTRGTDGLSAGALLGAIGAVLGAGIGAAGGHEERFEVTP
jgi:hypothetical protein